VQEHTFAEDAMKITIDNLMGQGAVEYTGALDGTVAPRVERRINQPALFTCSLLGQPAGFVLPVSGARITVTKASGEFLFSGYLTQAPQCEYLGWGEQGAVYRYNVVAESEEVLLDQKALPNRAPFVARTAGSALRQLVQDLLPGGFDVSGVQELDPLASYTVNPQKKFSYHAGEIALAARASYRTMNGALGLSPVGTASYELDESDLNFSPQGLKVSSPRTVINDVTVIGLDEPQAYVRDYFVGDGVSLRFYLSQKPFQQNRPALIDEQYDGSGLDTATWAVNDPTSAISVAAQSLLVNGGAGRDGGTTVSFIEQVELGGALELQHGDVSFTGASQGIIGGLYAGSILAANCLAGFQVTPSGGQSNIRALVNGSATGPVVTTTAGHRYLMTTYLYAREIYRTEETFHSSAHPAGNGLGGSAVPAEVRIVLELQDVDPLNPASMVAPATVLFDDVISNAPGFCSYALVNAVNMQCSVAYTYAAHISMAEVRTALANSPYTTSVVESQVEGGQCAIVSSTTLDFYPQYAPAVNTLIVATYRGSGRAVAEVANPAAIAALQNGSDDGKRGVVRTMKAPSARTQMDCENAALAMLDDAAGAAWSGSYQTWSDFLPGGAADIFPGDGLNVNLPSRNATFSATVRKVNIDLLDPANDRGMYLMEFANDLAEPLARQDAASGIAVPLQDVPVQLSTTQVGSYYLPDLKDAQLTAVTSTTVQVDAGMAPGSGYGIEVRAHDFGWSASDDRNLIGRFSTQTFTLTRLARSQNYFLRLYDTSSPPRYSRYSAALHVDYPYE
jgi:hypothetical protein